MSKYIFVIIIFIAIAVAGRILYLQLNSKLAPVVEIQALSTVLTPLTIAQPNYAVNVKASDLPQTVALYEISSTQSLAQVSSLTAPWFNFTSQPITREGATGAFSVWNDADRSLIIGRKPLQIAFKKTPLFVTLPRLTLADETFTASAQEFLQQTKAVKTPFTVSTPQLTYLEPRFTEPLVVDRAQATVIRDRKSVV